MEGYGEDSIEQDGEDSICQQLLDRVNAVEDRVANVEESVANIQEDSNQFVKVSKSQKLRKCVFWQ